MIASDKVQMSVNQRLRKSKKALKAPLKALILRSEF